MAIILIIVIITTGMIIVFDYRKCRKKIIILFSLSLAIIAFSYVPAESNDLYVWYSVIGSAEKYGINLLSASNNNGLYVFYFILYIIKIIGVKELLPFIVTLITYYIFLSVYISVVAQNSIKSMFVSMYILLFLAIFHYAFIVSGLRFYLGTAIYIYACYRDWQLDKKDIFTYICYSLPLFIHHAIFVFLLFRIIIAITDKRKYLFRAIVLLLCTFYFWSNQIISIGGDLLAQYSEPLSYKIEKYSEPLENTVRWRWEVILFLLIVYFACIMFDWLFTSRRTINLSIVIQKDSIKSESRLTKYRDLSILFVSLSIGDMYAYVLAERFIRVAIFLMILHIFNAMKIDATIKDISHPNRNLIPIFSLLFSAVIITAFYLQYRTRLIGYFLIF